MTTDVRRPIVPQLEHLLGHTFRVLDDGFVRVIDYMGDDKSVVQAARVSYGAGTKRLQEDTALIRYLMRHRHTTPFEMCELKLHVRVPMDTWRQWIRHRTANVNEYSTRYSIAIDATQRTDANAWRLQSLGNRQGSNQYLPLSIGESLSQREREMQEQARAVYDERISKGVAREQARKDLPLSTYTEAYWKTDLHNLLRFLDLRLDSRAQWEIRQYATVIGETIVASWVPAVWQAFVDFHLESLRLSRIERVILSALTRAMPERALELAQEYGLLQRDTGGGLRRNRERDELESKLRDLGVPIPW